jgi:hypothetical protein
MNMGLMLLVVTVVITVVASIELRDRRYDKQIAAESRYSIDNKHSDRAMAAMNEHIAEILINYAEPPGSPW